MCLVGESFLGRIDVVVHPLQQLLARRSDHLGLHIVHMRVDEARREDAAGIVGDGHVSRQARPHVAVGACGLDHPIAADDQPVGLMHEGLGRIDQEGIAGEADNRAAESGNVSIRHGSIFC